MGPMKKYHQQCENDEKGRKSLYKSWRPAKQCMGLQRQVKMLPNKAWDLKAINNETAK